MKPISVGKLKKILAGIPDTAQVILLSDEEGNQLHRLYEVAVDNVKKPSQVYLIPAGEELDQ